MLYLASFGVTVSDIFSDCYGNEFESLKTKKDIVLTFKKMLKYIIEDIIDNNVGFRFFKWQGYISMFDITEEDFKRCRYHGFLQDVDMVATDFKATRLYYVSVSKTRLFKVPIYLGEELQTKLMDKMNTGKRMYSSRIKTYDEYIDVFKEMFPKIPEKELIRFMKIGFSRMGRSMASYGAFTSRGKVLQMYIGDMSLKKPQRVRQLVNNYNRSKLRIKWVYENTPFSGYYIGITESQLKNFARLNVKSKYWVTFPFNVAKKIKEEYRFQAKKVYIFRLDLEEENKGFFTVIKDKKFKNPYTCGYFERGVYYEESIYWKDLLRTYIQEVKNEERSNINV